MPAPELRNIGPQDPDEAASLIGEDGIAQGGTARELLRRHAKAVPDEVKQSMLLPEGGTPDVAHLNLTARSRALVLSEVGRKGKIGKKEKIVGAKVRGTTPEDLIVVYAIQTEDGRTAKGILDYNDLSASQQAYDSAAATAATPLVLPEGEEGAGVAKLVADLQAQVAELSSRLDDQDEAAGEDEEKAAATSEEGAAAAPLEPQEGYDGLDADQARDLLDKAIANDEDELAKDIVRYEIANKDRKTVLDTEKFGAIIAEVEDEDSKA